MPVLETYTNEVTEICTLTINGESIETTVGHKFYTTKNGWMSAGDLSEGDTVELADGSSGTVDSVEITELDEPVTVYNFCVMDFHTYYVGESEVLVHNRQCGSKADVSGSSGNSVVNKSGRNTEIPWSSGTVSDAAKQLESGARSVTVKNRSQAEELFLGLYQGEGYVNVTGMDAMDAKNLLGGK